jgi:steroid delta-isomerase-like uncharacterized protein
MSPDQAKSLVRQYFEQVVNRVDRSAATELVAADLVFHSPYTPQPTRDRESFLGMLDVVHAAIDGFLLVEHDVVAEGDRVATRWTVTGTHKGELAGMPPSGRPLSISGLSIYRIADGRIAEGWVQDDIVQALGRAAG